MTSAMTEKPTSTLQRVVPADGSSFSFLRDFYFDSTIKPSIGIDGCLGFYLYYYSGEQTLLEDLDRFFRDSGASTPQSAPNWKDMQTTEDKTKLWFKENRSLRPAIPPQPAK